MLSTTGATPPGLTAANLVVVATGRMMDDVAVVVVVVAVGVADALAPCTVCALPNDSRAPVIMRQRASAGPRGAALHMCECALHTTHVRL